MILTGGNSEVDCIQIQNAIYGISFSGSPTLSIKNSSFIDIEIGLYGRSNGTVNLIGKTIFITSSFPVYMLQSKSKLKVIDSYFKSTSSIRNRGGEDYYQNIFCDMYLRHRSPPYRSCLFIDCEVESGSNAITYENSLWVSDLDASNELFKDYTNHLGNDGIIGTLDDGLRHKKDSPLIDSGFNSSISPSTYGEYEDMLGNSRVVGNSVDIGPYEYDSKIDDSQNSSTNNPISLETNTIEEFSPTGWAYWAKHPWYYNNGEWYYMKALGSRIFLYNYSSREWHSLPE